MLIQYGQDLGNYLYDVFVAKFDFWLGFGLVAQLFFTARFLVQWISSERAGKSVIPFAFWIFSMGGGLMTLVYGVVKREPVAYFRYWHPWQPLPSVVPDAITPRLRRMSGLFHRCPTSTPPPSQRSSSACQ